MTHINYFNARSVASAAAALAITVTITMAISWMFMDTAKVARAAFDSGRGPVATVSALVR